MKTHFKKVHLIVLLFFFILIDSAKADFSYQEVSPKLLIQDADIIVIGKIEKVEYAKPDKRAMDIGTIKIQKILKGEGKFSHIFIVFNSKNRTQKSNMDITFNIGNEGIWMLKANKKNAANPDGSHYRAYHPDCFQQKDTEIIIQNILQKKSFYDLEKNIYKGTSNQKKLFTKLLIYQGIEDDIPFLLDMLSENESVIFNNSRKALYKITNQIFIDKEKFTQKEKDELITCWRKWWEDNKDFIREKWIKDGIIRDIKLLKTVNKEMRKKVVARLLDFTGQYGFVGSEYRPETPEAIGTWENWWTQNKNRTLKEWTTDLITSSDPYLRQYGVMMIIDMARFGNRDMINYLIKTLMDPYPIVQERAIEGLYILTGERFGFDYRKSPEQNLDSIKLWMDWWGKNK